MKHKLNFKHLLPAVISFVLSSCSLSEANELHAEIGSQKFDADGVLEIKCSIFNSSKEEYCVLIPKSRFDSKDLSHVTTEMRINQGTILKPGGDVFPELVGQEKLFAVEQLAPYAETSGNAYVLNDSFPSVGDVFDIRVVVTGSFCDSLDDIIGSTGVNNKGISIYLEEPKDLLTESLIVTRSSWGKPIRVSPQMIP